MWVTEIFLLMELTDIPPNIDKMAAEGVRFTHFLVGQPISGASRAGLLTGCYPNRIGFPALRGQIRTTVSIQRR